MQDLFEGMCNYSLTSLLHNLIFYLKLFSLRTLNERIKCFGYNDTEISNKPPPITSEKEFECQQAEYVLCFSRYLGIMIGDLIPVNLPIWQVWCTLREIIDTVTALNIHFSEHIRSKVAIEEHNDLYVQFFGRLKPKHHHLHHYHTVLKMSGPLVHLWSMRSEQKHRESKMISNISCNFKNIAYTLAIKAQLKLCYQLLSSSASNMVFGEMEPLSFDLYIKYFSNLDSDKLHQIKWVNINGTKYTFDTILALDCSENMPFLVLLITLFCFPKRKYTLYVILLSLRHLISMFMHMKLHVQQ